MTYGWDSFKRGAAKIDDRAVVWLEIQEI